MTRRTFCVELRAILAFVAVIVCQNASAEWYMDVTYSLNQAGLEGDGEQYGIITELQVDNKSTGFQITAGFSWNSYLDLEIGYADFGSQSVRVA